MVPDGVREWDMAEMQTDKISTHNYQIPLLFKRGFGISKKHEIKVFIYQQAYLDFVKIFNKIERHAKYFKINRRKDC